MKYCKKCLYPDTKPQLKFNDDGICEACLNSDKKDSVDWESRKKQLKEIAEKYRKSDGTYDCVIPVSGGKDSHYQALYARDELGLNPLLVNFIPRDLVELGRRNIENLKSLGFDYIEFTPNPRIYRKLAKIGLTEFGDITWPEHHGLFIVPIKIAAAFKIPLVIWGENPQFEYGGPGLGDEMNYEWLKKFGGFWLDECTVKGIATKQNIELKFLNPYVYPTKEELEQMNLRSVFLFYFLKYNVYDVLDHVKKHGFNVDDKPKEGTYTNWENLDEKYTGMHDYFKWIKYGFGRATDHASLDIRLGKISRDEGIELVKKHEGKIPDRYFDEFLNDMELDKEEFYNVVDKFANKEIFKLDENGKFLRDHKIFCFQEFFLNYFSTHLNLK
jgi:N-acetyl sugar amidotransferase